MDLNTASAYEIANQIRHRQMKASDVLTHFVSKAREATEKTNCITKFIDDAIEEAIKLDKQLEAGVTFSEEEYPLIGVPVSIKDVFDIENHPAVSGYRERLTSTAIKEAACVEILRKCGAIPFCHTNVCQFTMTLESSNPVYGQTTNPHDSRFTSGGSTSGEAPLVKLGGSVLGVGSDIGGSLRVPAHFCGVYTFKPTPHRIPVYGHVSPTPGQEAVIVSAGPMARNVTDLHLFMKSFLSKECWKYDPSGIPLPYREFKVTDPLRVGYILSDGVFPASPVCQRAVFEVVECLRKAGHQVELFEFPQLMQARALGQKLLTADQLSGSIGKLVGEGIHSTIARYARLTTLPDFIKKIGSCLAQLFGQPILAETFINSCRLSIPEYWAVQAQRTKLNQEFQSQWQSQNLDALLLPPLATPAFPHGSFLDIIPGISYSFLANLLNLPSGIIPVTTVTPQDQVDIAWIKDQLAPTIRPEQLHKRLYAHACPVTEHPLPVGVQILARRFEDEKVLSIMEVIDQLLHPSSS